MKKISGIYKITNLITGIIYIGSAFDLYDRKVSHFSRGGHNRYLKRAFKKYGKENFKWEVLELVPQLKNESRLDFKSRLVDGREQYYLDTLLFAQEFILNKDKRFRKLSYNISPTADSPLGIKRTVIHRKNNSEAKKKYYLTHDGPNKGRKRSEESKKKASLSLKGIPQLKKYKPVVQFDLDGNFIREFISIKEAQQTMNISHAIISNCCTKRPHYNTAGGFKWMFKKDYEEFKQAA